MINYDTNTLKIPPHSIEAEQAVLGGVMLDNSVWDQISEKLGIDDFYDQNHKAIFKVMINLSNDDKPIDIVTVSEFLEKKDELEKTGGI